MRKRYLPVGSVIFFRARENQAPAEGNQHPTMFLGQIESGIVRGEELR